jgi:ABC-2 type transport system permease protein
MNKVSQTFSQIKIMIEREIWEHKTAFIYTPLVLIGFIVICETIFLLSPDVQQSLHNFYHQLMHNKPSQQEIISNISSSLFIPLNILLWIIIANYVLGCFYNERKDKSILFWQSLPIRQSHIITAKIITALVIVPIITLCYSALYILLFQTILSLFFWFYTGMFPTWYLQPSVFYHVYMHMFSNVGKQIFILLPLLSWFLLCSAYVKKTPVIFACLPPLAIAMVDMILDPKQVIYNFFTSTLSQLNASFDIIHGSPPSQSIFTFKYIIISMLLSYLLIRISVSIRNQCLYHEKI